MSDNYHTCYGCGRLFDPHCYGVTKGYCPKCHYLRRKEIKETERICKEFFDNETKQEAL